jgi:mono/diheme cytochrome c family protein
VLRFALVAVVAIAACDRERPTGTADGPSVFARNCATCHGDRGHPSEAMTARYNVRDLAAPEFRKRVTPTLVAKQVRRGSDNHLMPSFEYALSDAEIDAVAAFVASQTFAR